MTRNAVLAVIMVMGFGLPSLTRSQATKNLPPGIEKCYGISKAGQNDGGISGVDGAKTAWLALPKGTCDNIVGGSTTEGTGS